MLYIYLFLHQTTTFSNDTIFFSSCISIYSYIKPQPLPRSSGFLQVVYLSIPTSNHNLGSLSSYITGFYIKDIAKEMVINVDFCCKIIKKILIGGVPSVLFSSFPYPNSSQCHHIAYLLRSKYSPSPSLVQ